MMSPAAPSRFLSICLLLMSLSSAGTFEAPATRRQAVTTSYHGVEVVEHFRWLEDPADPSVQRWIERQNTFTRRHLDRLPDLVPLRSRLRQLLTAEAVRHWSLATGGGRLFAIRHRPPREQPVLVVMPRPEEPDAARVVVDPNALHPDGAAGIDWFVPSPDGRLVAVSISTGGSESGDLHVVSTETGRQVEPAIPRVNGGTTGGDVAWLPDGSGFFYTRLPWPGERPAGDLDFYQQVYLHRLGTPITQDRYELGKELPRIAEIRLEMDHGSGRLLASVQDGDSNRFAHYLRSRAGAWRPLSRFGDGLVHAVFGASGDLFVVSRAGAPMGKILRVSRHHLDPARAEEVVPEGPDAIETGFWSPPTLLATEGALLVVYQLGGPSQLRAFDLDGHPLATPSLPPESASGSLTALPGGDVLFTNGSYLEPETWYRFHPQQATLDRLPLNRGGVDLEEVEVVREHATSADGTRVPLTLLLPPGVRRDGSNPCLVTGYGGFGANAEPDFDPARKILFDHGVLFVKANLRGGGELGADWHAEGTSTRKQNVFDDFAAVLEHLVDRGYTSPSRLAIVGVSNGGLLVGATLVQRPELMTAAVGHVGIFDMLRFELSPNGAFNTPEYGSVEDPEELAALHAYSPYHNVRDGTRYPAALFLTGANDPRVDPMHSRKMVARLQTATAPDGGPILLRAADGSGHEAEGLSDQLAQTVDVYAFLLDRLGVRLEQDAEDAAHHR